MIQQIINFLSKVLSVVVGAFLDPVGAINSFFCMLIDILAAVWPSSPFTIASLLSGVPDFIGQGVFYEALSMIGAIAVIFIAIKIYKLIPFV